MRRSERAATTRVAGARGGGGDSRSRGSDTGDRRSRPAGGGRMGQPEVGGAGAGGLPAAGDLEVDPAGLQVAVTPAQPLPVRGGQGQAQVGSLGPGRDGPTPGQDHDGPPLPGPGGQAAGVGRADPAVRGGHDQVEPVEQGAQHRGPSPARWGDHRQPLQGHPGLGRGQQAGGGQAHQDGPRTGTRWAGPAGTRAARSTPAPPGPPPTPGARPPPGSTASRAGAAGRRCSSVRVTGLTRSCSATAIPLSPPAWLPRLRRIR